MVRKEGSDCQDGNWTGSSKLATKQFKATMAREPKQKLEKKTRSSGLRGQVKPKAQAASTSKHGSKLSATKEDSTEAAVVPTRSILKDSKPTNNANLEIDFPRGAPAPVRSAKREKAPVAVSEERGLFDVGNK